MTNNSLPQLVSATADVDRFMAKYYGRKVEFWLIDSETGERRQTPLVDASTVEFNATLAFSYARRALDAQARSSAHQAEVDRGWLAVKVLVGEGL